MKKNVILLYVKKSLLTLIAIMSILTLLFSLLKVGISGLEYSENGFDCLSFNSYFITESYQWGNSLLGVFTIIELLLGIVAVCISIYYFFIQQNKMCDTVVVIAGLFNSIFYLIEGLVFRHIFITSWGYEDYAKFITTDAFYPVIIIGILLVAYVIMAQALKKFSVETSGKKGDLDKLLVYKKLLDNGAITKEEYEQKKKELL